MTQREHELEQEVARLKRYIDGIQPYLCAAHDCQNRGGIFCPICGAVIRED